MVYLIYWKEERWQTFNTQLQFLTYFLTPLLHGKNAASMDEGVVNFGSRQCYVSSSRLASIIIIIIIIIIIFIIIIIIITKTTLTRNEWKCK